MKSIRLSDGLVVGSAAEMFANPGIYVNYWGPRNPGEYDSEIAVGSVATANTANANDDTCRCIGLADSTGLCVLCHKQKGRTE